MISRPLTYYEAQWGPDLSLGIPELENEVYLKTALLILTSLMQQAGLIVRCVLVNKLTLIIVFLNKIRRKQASSDCN